jgi:hypothetical protein
MNSKSILFLSCFTAATLTASAVSAAPHGGHGGGHFASMPARGGHTFTRSGMGTWSGQRWGGGTWSGRNWNGGNWSGQRWGGGNWNGNWRHHHHNNNDVIFIGSFGFPYWGWGWGYPYGSYGYGYPYGYDYGYGYPYGYGYDYNYGNSYGDAGYGDQGYGYSDRHRGESSVAQLQRRLASAGYYHGAIDGLMGPETRRAIRAYERSQNQREYGMTDRY